MIHLHKKPATLQGRVPCAMIGIGMMENGKKTKRASKSLILYQKWVIIWVVPPPSNSHHQDYHIFSRDPYKPSFATVTGRGDNPSYNQVMEPIVGLKADNELFFSQCVWL